MVGGLTLLGGGLFTMARFHADSGYLPFLGGLVLCGLGIGLTRAAGTAAITGSLGHGQQGVASAMNGITSEVGSAIGIALIGSVYGGHHRHALPSSVDQLPPRQPSPSTTPRPPARRWRNKQTPGTPGASRQERFHQRPVGLPPRRLRRVPLPRPAKPPAPIPEPHAGPSQEPSAADRTSVA
ncbi:hypothetical protein [Streptomyces vietnamensis]|uniref:hypothetical protein n=1 Tax=Streptomyces vietnamensis TaxID=362257 RepID=UPI00341D5464